MRFDTSFEGGYVGTLRFPPLPDLNDWLRFQVAGTSAIRVAKESFTVIEDYPFETLRIRTVPQESILRQLFDRAGIEAKRSLPGEVAWQLIRQLGNLSGARVFKYPGVRRMLGSTAIRTGIRRRHAEDLIKDGGSFEQAPPLYSRGEAMTARDVLGYLIERRIVIPGLELDCPQCRHASFYPPREVQDDVQCPRCAHSFSLGPALSGDPIRYRLSGLLDEPGERAVREGQPPSIAVLLTLMQLGNWHGGIDGYVFDVSNDLSGAVPDCETDLVAISYGTRPELHTHILVGECKGRGTIDQSDVDKMSAVLTAVRSSRVQCDLVFSTTRAAFSGDELQLFGAYTEAQHANPIFRRPPILLTAADLESENLAHEAAAGQLTFQGFDGLVELTRQRYFAA